MWKHGPGEGRGGEGGEVVASVIPWLFLIPPGLVALAALVTLVHRRSAAGRALALLRQGGIHLYKGEAAEAEAAFRAGLALRGEDGALLGSLGALLVSQGRHEEARGLLAKARARAPKDAGLALTEGRCLAGLGEAEAAKGCWASIAEGSEAYVDAQGELAALHEARGELVEAAAALERAIAKGQVHQVRPFKKELARLKKGLEA
jgi:tetratricopeptide (TPR) repeat protein